MNEGEIAENFIRAAEIDRAMPERVGPQQPRSVALPYVHDWVDKLGWGSKKLEEERKEFWERLGLKATSRELSQLDILRAWLAAITDEKERRCLLAWARAKAGGMSFKKWCFKVEGIHPETGRRRKDRAISRISSELASNRLLHHGLQVSGVLLEPPETAYLEDMFEDAAPKEKRTFTWRDDPALKSVFDPEQRDTSWADKRNKRRRQERERRKAQEEREKDRAA